MHSRSTIITEFLTFQANIQLYHWATKSHARHEAAGSLYTSMSALIDQFVETLLGHNRSALRLDTPALPITILSHRNAVSYLKTFSQFLQSLQLTPDLANIRDEMCALVHQTLYLFSQH